MALLCVSGCGVIGSETRAGCEWAKPIFTSKDDVLTDGTAADILNHNETWQAVCG